jgi:hypothetical protein
MIAIILCLIAEKNRVWKNWIFHLSPIAMRLSRYAGATPGTGCCGDSIAGDIHRTGSCPLFELKFVSLRTYLPRKEVIQPHLPVRLPCYDFTPLTLHTFGASPLSVGPATSGADDSGGVTGGVYKARERIHRGMLIRDY